MEVMVAPLYKLTRSAEEWSEQDVSAWLTSNGFPHLAMTVEENGVDGTVLLNLDHESLKDLGVVKVGPRIKLLRLIAKAKVDGVEAEQKAVKKKGTSGGVRGKDNSFGLANVKLPPADAFRVIQQQDERILALEAHIWELRRIADSIRECTRSNASVLSNNSNNSINPSHLYPFKQFQSPNSPQSPGLPERKPSHLPISPSSGERCRLRSDSEPLSSPRLNLEEASSPSCTSSDDPSLHANQKSLSPSSSSSSSQQHKPQRSLDATSGQLKPNFGPHLSPQAFIARKPSLTRRARSPMPPRGVPGSEGPMEARPPFLRSLSNAEQFNHKRSASAASHYRSHSQRTLSKFSGVRASAADTVQTVLTQQLTHLHDPQAWQKFVLMVRYGEGPRERCLAYDEVPLIVYRSIKVRYEKVGFVIKSAEDAHLSSPLKHQIITAAGTDKGAPRRSPSVDEVATSPSLSPSIRAGNLPPDVSGTFEHALAICGYRAEADDEISLKAGERLNLQAKANGRYLVTRVLFSSSSPTSVPQCGWVSAACAIETTQLITATSLRDALSAPVDASVLPPSFSHRVALLDHTPTGSWAGELHLLKGDQVKVYRRRQHWSYTRKELTGERGWCPSWILGHESPSPLRKPEDVLDLRRSNTDIRPSGMSSRRRLSRVIGPMELSEKFKAQLVSPPSPLPPIQSSPQWLMDRKV